MAEQSLQGHGQFMKKGKVFPSKIIVSGSTPVNDYFVEKDGQRFAGIHLLIDFWEAKNLTNRITVENALREAAISANATAINLQLNQYSENGGISGILVLAESHISIHTWPERSFAAIDIFMCGVCNPYDCIAVLKKAFEPGNTTLLERRRDLLP